MGARQVDDRDPALLDPREVTGSGHLVQAFGEFAIACSRVSRTIRALSWATPDEEARGLSGRPPSLIIDARICQFLIDSPSGSIRQIATGTGIPVLTVWHVRTTRLGYVSCKPRLRPYTLSEAQRMERLQGSQVLLSTLRRAKSAAWRFFSTGYEP
jgi:hypothetical protein